MKIFQHSILKAWQKNWLHTTSLLLLSSVLVACGGDEALTSDGSNNAGVPAEESVDEKELTSEVVISFTDDEGDFLAYDVEVTSLMLTRADGLTVETAPAPTSIDFTEYTELTEFFTVATVPVGQYTSATLNVNYANAEILVEGKDGEPLKALAIDADGNKLDAFQLEVKLNQSHPFIIAPGIPAHVTIDFDLEASNVVDMSADPVTVLVSPVLLADTQLEEPKKRRLRGIVDEVSIEEGIIDVNIRPFRHLNDRRFGKLPVIVTDDTSYEINDEVYQGQEGLRVLASLSAPVPLVAYGMMNLENLDFEADKVRAGSAVPWSNKDAVSGYITAREGNLLTVEGRVRSLQFGRKGYMKDISISISDSTTVIVQGDINAESSIAELSVGQRVDVLGMISREIEDDGDNFDYFLDATQGKVRMLYTTVKGSVVNASPLTVNLQGIGGLATGNFDFSGTGIEPADPNNYEINTGLLSLEGIALNAPIKVRGHVTDFGAAPEDFEARTIASTEDVKAAMQILWNEGVADAITVNGESSLTIKVDPELSPFRHHVVRGGVITDLTMLDMAITVSPSDQRGKYILISEGVALFMNDFPSFAVALAAKLNGTNQVHKVTSTGAFDTNTATMVAAKLVVHLK